MSLFSFLLTKHPKCPRFSLAAGSKSLILWGSVSSDVSAGTRTRPKRSLFKVSQGMIKVKARGNESVEQMLRRFKKMCEKEGLTKEIKRTSYYEKPSERRRRRIRKAIKRAEKTTGW